MMDSNSALKIGIAGYGKMGKIREQSIRDSGDAKLVAIFDVACSEHDDKEIKLCSSYQELIESDVDAIIVSAYVKVAADYVVRALNAGKHVVL